MTRHAAGIPGSGSRGHTRAQACQQSSESLESLRYTGRRIQTPSDSSIMTTKRNGDLGMYIFSSKSRKFSTSTVKMRSSVVLVGIALLASTNAAVLQPRDACSNGVKVRASDLPAIYQKDRLTFADSGLRISLMLQQHMPGMQQLRPMLHGSPYVSISSVSRDYDPYLRRGTRLIDCFRTVQLVLFFEHALCEFRHL